MATNGASDDVALHIEDSVVERKTLLADGSDDDDSISLDMTAIELTDTDTASNGHSTAYSSTNGHSKANGSSSEEFGSLRDETKSTSSSALLDDDEDEEWDRDKALKRQVSRMSWDQKKLNLRRLVKQSYEERYLIGLATLFLFLSASANLAIPAYMGRIIDAIGKSDKDEGTRKLNSAVISLVIITSFGSIASFARGMLFTVAGERVVARLRRRLFDAIVSQEIGMFDMTRTGELINRLASDTSVLKNAVTINVSLGFRWLATILGGITYLFFISWKLTLVMLAVVPVIAVGARKYGIYVRGLSKQVQEALAGATETAEETVASIRTVRSFAREQHQRDQYSEKIEHTYQLGKQMGIAYGIFIGVLGAIAGFAVVLVLYVGGKLVLSGELSPGVLTSFVLYTLTVGFALAGLSGLFGEVMKAVGANERVFQLIDRESEIALTKGKVLGGNRILGQDQPSPIQGHVVFTNVNFSYPSRPSDQVLKDFCIELRPGTVTALVGPSGGGKTTVVSLIERFYDPQDGFISIDGHELTSLDPTWLHQYIGLVSQEPVLFSGTIWSNIVYAVGEQALPNDKRLATELVHNAAKAANAHDFIMSFSDGYETRVGERGVRLSGGQKQRIAIARAVLMNPRILLLDEATSALDAESEHLVQEALDRLMKGRTTLVIAHRLSTVKNADNVVVVKKGQVVEQGTHSQLLKRSGVYAKLVRRQLQQD